MALIYHQLSALYIELVKEEAETSQVNSNTLTTAKPVLLLLERMITVKISI